MYSGDKKSTQLQLFTSSRNFPPAVALHCMLLAILKVNCLTSDADTDADTDASPRSVVSCYTQKDTFCPKDEIYFLQQKEKYLVHQKLIFPRQGPAAHGRAAHQYITRFLALSFNRDTRVTILPLLLSSMRWLHHFDHQHHHLDHSLHDHQTNNQVCGELCTVFKVRPKKSQGPCPSLGVYQVVSV